MSYSILSNSVWKWVQVDWTTIHTYYWDDFNPTNATRPSSFSSCWTTWTTTNFDLSWFQPWHEVWCAVWQFQFSNSYLWTLVQHFMRSSDWVHWENRWTFELPIDWWANHYSGWYIYFWVDDDEVRPWYTYYKVKYEWSWTGLNDLREESPIFTVSNLSIDSTLHKSWYFRVQWSHLCYTDWTWWELWNRWYWYKHSIAYDGNFSEYVWTDYSWYVRLETDVVRRIYYVDEYWYKRRTYEARNWYNYPSWQWYRPWDAVYWSIWCPWDYDDADEWYWHLCFVNQWWYLMRILNWPPSWVA